MSSSNTLTDFQQGHADDEQRVGNVDSMQSDSTTRLDTSAFPSTPIRGASSPNAPSTPESVYRYSSFPCTHRALASSPISASPVSAGSSSPATPVPAHFVPIVISPGTYPHPITAFIPPTPPHAMTPREEEDLEENRVAILVHAILERCEKDDIGRALEERRRNEDQQERARVVRNEQQLRERLRAQQEAFEQSLKATTSAPAASTPVTASVARRRTTKESTLAREMKSLAQLGGAGNTISLGKRKRQGAVHDDEERNDVGLEDKKVRHTARTAATREIVVPTPNVWAGRLRLRAARKEHDEESHGDGGPAKKGKAGRRGRNGRK